MATTARLDLSVWRNDDVYEFPIRVRGIDLTPASMAMEVRLAPDTPGPPLFALAKVDPSNTNAEGLRVAGVSIVDGVPETDLRIRIEKTTRQALPYAGELGDATRLSYALVISGKSRLVGSFIVLASAYASNNAPSNRGSGAYVSSAGVPSGSALLTIVQDEIVVLDISGFDVVAGQAAIANNAAAEAKAAAAAATAGAAGLSFPIIAEAGSVANAWKLTLPAGINLLDKARYRFFAPTPIAGDLVIEGAGANPVRYRTGAVVGVETRVQTGDQVELEWDNGPGQLFRWAGSDRDPNRLNILERDPDPFAPLRKAILETPHGTMTKDANGNSVVTPVFLPFFSNGSSVNTPIANPNVRNGGAIPGTEPSAMLTTLFNRAFGPGVQLANRNKSRGSTAVNEFPAQRAELVVNGDASLLNSCVASLQVPGMNDFAAGGYNTGPTFPAAGIKNYEAYLVSEILANRRVWICTSVTYHIGRNPDRERVPANNDQYWPYYMAQPVGATQQVPAFADSLVTLDRTGNGILTRGSRRYDHGNNLLRDLARRLNARFPGMVVLIDADHSFWLNVIEPQLTINSTDADRVAAFDVAFTDPGFGQGAEQQSAHPGTVGQWGGYGRPLAEMVDAMRGAPGPTWWFRGDQRKAA